MRTNFSSVGAVLVCGVLGACGGSVADNSSTPPADQDASEDAGPSTEPVEAAAEAEAGPVDHGAPSNVYPAFMPSMGQIDNNGGFVMNAPVIVPITWNTDPGQAQLDNFVDTIGSSSYWQVTTSQYGVGAAVSGTANHVHMSTTAPTSMADSDLQSMVTTNAGNGWPAATQNTIYAFFLDPTTSLNLGSGTRGGGGGSGDACSQGVGGYHEQVNVGSVTTAYAVVPSCNFKITPTVADQSTTAMSHELVEASTDPQPNANNPGWIGFTNQTFAFDYFQSFQDEIGDACELFADSYFDDQETTPIVWNEFVQRMWSNASGPQGHDPCQPELPGEVYFNVTPLSLQTVNVAMPPELTGAAGTTQVATNGFKVLEGTSDKFQVGFYSEADTGGPWTISAVAGNPLTAGTSGDISSYNKSALTASIDMTSGVNGQKAWVTVNVATTGSTFKGELLTIISTDGNTSHYMPIWIAGQ
jgi:hypothetical protein